MQGPAYWRAGSGTEVLEGRWSDDDPAGFDRRDSEFVVALGDTPPNSPPPGWRGYWYSPSGTSETLPDRWLTLGSYDPGSSAGQAVLTSFEESNFLESFEELRVRKPVFLDLRSRSEDALNSLHTLPVRAWLQSEGSLRPPYYDSDFFPRGAPGREPLFVFFHGYTGSPENWDYMVDELDDRSYFAPLLPGHGLKPDGFAEYGAEEWNGAAGFWSERLTREHDTNVAVGLSMGGALSVIHREHYDALVLINTPLRVPDWRRMFFPVYEWVKTYHTFEDVEKTIPVSSLRDLQEILGQCRERLEEVDVPVLVINHEGDDTVSPNHGRVLANRIPDADHKIFEDGIHESPTDPDVARTLHDVITTWLDGRNLL